MAIDCNPIPNCIEARLVCDRVQPADASSIRPADGMGWERDMTVAVVVADC